MGKGADLTNTFKSQILLFNPVNDKCLSGRREDGHESGKAQGKVVLINDT